MKALGLVLIVIPWHQIHVESTVMGYSNMTIDPASQQLFDFKRDHPKIIGLLTTSSGKPIEVRDTIQLNSDQFSSEFHLDLHTTFDAERIPERVVHAKGSGAFGYFIVTNDISKYTNADVFNGIGKKTPIVTTFSSVFQNFGGTDVASEVKGMSINFYTDQGNLDLLCLQTPVYFYKDQNNFANFMHAFKRNPQTFLLDFTAQWDILTLKPEFFHLYLWTQSDYGSPNGYRKMDAFAIHTFELSNEKGERHSVRFNFRTEQGLEGLTMSQQAAIQGIDLDYYTRDLCNAIESKEYPSWRMEMDVLIVEDVKQVNYDPFDPTILWNNGTYNTVQIGKVVLNQNPENMFASIEQSAFNPGNLVPGIPGPADYMYKARKLFYRDTQDYRLGTSHNKILVNLPRYTKTYVRDGRPPTNENMKNAPNFYPNSHNGPMPYVDETRPKETLTVFERNAADFQASADFYNKILVNDTQRQHLVERLVASLISVSPPVRKRAFEMLYLVDIELGHRVEVGVKTEFVNVMNKAR